MWDLSMMQNLNDKIAVKITQAVGTMWCAYLFAALALISFPDAVRGGSAQLVSWTAQTFLQLVLLSIIMVGQRVSGEKIERRADDDHRLIKAEFDALRLMVEEMQIMHKELHKLLEPKPKPARSVSAPKQP
jgi:hypothetical protein